MKPLTTVHCKSEREDYYLNEDESGVPETWSLPEVYPMEKI